MTKTIKHEPMRIAGKKVDAEKNINVHYPYTNEIIGTVPAGSAEHAKNIVVGFCAMAYLEPMAWGETRRLILNFGKHHAIV